MDRSQRRREAELKVIDALSLLRLGRPEETARARLLLGSASRLAPGMTLAIAASAELDARYGKPPFDPAIALARRAASADPQCTECRAILGYIHMRRAWNWAGLWRQFAAAGRSRAGFRGPPAG